MKFKQFLSEEVDMKKLLTQIHNNPMDPHPYEVAMKAVNSGDTSHELEIIIRSAVASGFLEQFANFIAHASDKTIAKYKDLIKGHVKEYLEKHNLAQIKMKKLNRTKEERDEDKKYDTFVFVGVPKYIQQKDGHYKKELEIESLVKLDKYNVSDLRMVSQLKLRSHTRENGGVYIIKLPAGYIKKKVSHNLEPWLIKLIDEKKERI